MAGQPASLLKGVGRLSRYAATLAQTVSSCFAYQRANTLLTFMALHARMSFFAGPCITMVAGTGSKSVSLLKPAALTDLPALTDLHSPVLYS